MDRDDDATGGSGEVEERLPIVTGEPLNVEDYAARYMSWTKIKRLRFIADRCPALELEALRIAYDEIKKTGDVESFKEVVAKINGRLGENYGPDDDWADAVGRRSESRERELQSLLDNCMNTANRESIWDAYNMLGHFYYVNGNFLKALTNHISKRDYWSTSNQTVNTCLDVILVAIELEMFSCVLSDVTFMILSEVDLDAKTMSKLCCALALANLQNREYKHAAFELVRISPSIENSYSEVIVPQDIATYGGLCALATFGRQDLKRLVIDSRNFQEFLERVPRVKEIVNNFYASRFDSCLNSLAALKPTLLLDIHLHDNVEDLYAKIRENALIQYTLPLRLISLDGMAFAFGTSVRSLEQELTAIIAKRLIRGYIESDNRVLIIFPEHPILHVLQNSLQAVNERIRLITRVLNDFNYFL